MRKYLLFLPVVMLIVVLVGCHSNVTEGAQVTVNITAPANNAQRDQGTAVNIRAEVTSTEDIAKVEFRIDDGLLETRLEPASLVATATEKKAYTSIWETTDATLGAHKIEVKAYDTATPTPNTGNATVNVTIVQPPTAPPTVVITAPADGAQVSANFDVDVVATPHEPGATIAKVDVTFAGTTKTVTGATGTVNFNSALAPDGDQTILAVATDSLGVTGSAEITVDANNPAPTVAITAPAAGAEVIGNFDVTANATPQAAEATITKIDVSVNGLTKTITGPTGTVTFDSLNLQNGANTITAVATDSNGKTGQATRNITVNNPVPFTVSVQDATVASGANVTVPLVMSDTTGVAGFQMTINYDQTKLELIGGDAALVKGAAVPGGSMIMPNTTTPGVIRVVVAGTANFTADGGEILTIAFKAIGAAGPTVVDIDDTAGAPTKMVFADAMAAPLDPQPTAVPGTVTIQ